MGQVLNNGASVYAGERVRLRYQPTKNRGGGHVAPINAPVDGVYTVGVSMVALPTMQRAPIGLTAYVNGAKVYDAATDEDGVHKIQIAARTLSALATGRALVIELAFPPLTIPEARVAVTCELTGAINGVKYQPTKSGLNFRLKQGVRPMAQQPTPPTTGEEAPDGLTETADVLFAEDVPAGQ